MNFASIEYFAFLLIVWVAYRLLKLRGQNILLLIASYYFYGMWDWRFLSLIVISTFIDFWVGRSLVRVEDPKRRKHLLAVSVIANMSMLGFFKYFGFFVDSAVALLEGIGLEAHRPALQIVLPVGISFYTFQTLSYTIDIYRRKLQPTGKLVDFALFVAFFPQLVAGPIERASHLLPILSKQRAVTFEGCSRGVFLILLGLMKKIVIADGLSGKVDAIYGTGSDVSGLDVTLATYAFAFQILCDFSAYTDIARGTAKLFGIDLMDNFCGPYFARNPSDFWRRWHISLSTWLRDYLYVPLGGNRGSTVSLYRNLMITMVLGGLWHGAAWNFVLWGIYQGALLCMFRVFTKPKQEPIDEPTSLFGRGRSIALYLVGTGLFFQLTCYGWLLFRADSFTQIVDFTSLLFTPSGWGAGWADVSFSRPPLATLLGLCFLIPWEAMTYAKSRDDFYRSWHPFMRGLLVGVLAILLLMGLNNDASTFIYFQF